MVVPSVTALAGGGAGGGGGGFQASMKNPPFVLKTVKRTRNVFPETWLWSNVTVR